MQSGGSLHGWRAASFALMLAPMCGRFTQHLSWAELHRLADLIGQPRYNIAPTMQIEVVLRQFLIWIFFECPQSFNESLKLGLA
jgi:hypothetical protein